MKTLAAVLVLSFTAAHAASPVVRPDAYSARGGEGAKYTAGACSVSNRNCATRSRCALDVCGASVKRRGRSDAATPRPASNPVYFRTGVTTMVVRHGKVVAFEVHGKKGFDGPAMTRDTVFRIYSQTKPVTGVAMMMLFEEGKWRLDDPVTRYIPEFKNLKVWKGVDAEGKPILVPVSRPPTMREVMSHTAGFGYGLADKHPVDLMFRDKRILASNGLQDMINKVADTPLIYEPGTQWSYSVAVDIQGYLVEKLSGQTLGQFMESRIFKPLKMTDTAFYVPAGKASRLAAVYVGNRETGKIEEARKVFDNDMPTYLSPPAMESGGGGLVGTTMDYARFAQMIANKGELDGVRILAPTSVELMGTNVIPKDVLVNSNGTSGARFNEAVGFGLDFMVVKDARAAGTNQGDGTMSWGGAAGTWFWIDPKNDLFFLGMIHILNKDGDPALRNLDDMSQQLVYQALVDPSK